MTVLLELRSWHVSAKWVNSVERIVGQNPLEGGACEIVDWIPGTKQGPSHLMVPSNMN